MVLEYYSQPVRHLYADYYGTVYINKNSLIVFLNYKV